MKKTLTIPLPTIKMPSRRAVKKAIACATGAAILIGAVACTGQSAEEKARDKEQKSASVAPGVETLEVKNLKEKQKREEVPNAIRYVYLVSFGKPMGYYVTKGKISSNGSQKGPEEDIVQSCKNGDCAPVAVDGKQDDGSYGDGDPGIFFFTTEGVMVVTSLDYMQSDQPLPFDVPKLNKTP